jgi:hypothetical protein
MAPTFFRILLLAVVIYALLRGGRDERNVALISVAGFLLTAFALSPVAGRFESVEIKVFVVDAAVLAGFLAVALQSARFWPLWVAGIHLTATMGHLLKGLDTDLIPQAYAAALYVWGYAILVILAIGTWRGHKRRAGGRAEQLSAP